MTLEFENAISIQPLEDSGSGLQFQNAIYIQPKDEGGDTPTGKYVTPILTNMEYNSAGTGFYNSNATSACKYLGAATTGIIAFKQRSGQTLTTSNLYNIGHVDFNYTLGQLVALKVLDESQTSAAPSRSLVFGKTDTQNNFIPILYMDATQSIETLTIGITTDDNISTLTTISSGTYTTGQTWDTSQTSSTTHKTDGSPSTTTMGAYARIYEVDNGIQLLVYNGRAFRTYGQSEVFADSKLITNTTLVSRLQEISMVRIIPAQYSGVSESTAIAKAGLGLFDSEITSFTDFSTTKKTFEDLGENLIKYSD